jgi:glycosyltransferase involved in cell wall biosynthesis
MASMIPVSVAMATYNGQEYLRRQLDSLAAQSQYPAELVVSDDASEDDTIAIIEAFAKTSPFPVNIHRNETRLGFRANFMRAANLCRSELIAFCDQDDYWYPDKIKRSVKPFRDPEVLLAYHNADVVTLDGTRVGSLATFAAQKPVLTPLSADPWLHARGFTMVFRRSLLQLSNLWPNSRDFYDNSQPCAHDQWLFLLANVFGKIAYLDQPLAAYVQHGGNAFGWTNVGLFHSIKFYFRNRADGLTRQAKATDGWATIFRAAKSNLAGDWSDRAAAGAEYYGRLSSLYNLRISLYTSADLSDRLRAFGAILRRNGYAGASSLGSRTFIADLFLGIPIGPHLPHLSP